MKTYVGSHLFNPIWQKNSQSKYMYKYYSIKYNYSTNLVDKKMTRSIVSKPCFEDKKEAVIDSKFAYFEIIGCRTAQEDALAWEHYYDCKILKNLSPIQIGHRLWSAYLKINEAFNQSGGSTAATTIVKQGYFITATLGDAATFAVVYDEEDTVKTVLRLNKRVHKPSDNSERERIEIAGGMVSSSSGIPRVGGLYAVSRAIGDKSCKGMIAEPDIDIIDLRTVPQAYKIQLITTCDGFTDAAAEQSKKGHEDYLQSCLSELNEWKPGSVSEQHIASYLVWCASQRSRDNISVSVQTVKDYSKPQFFEGMTGIYDGHGGTAASHFIAEQIGPELKAQLKLDDKAYHKQDNSVKNKNENFRRDNILSPLNYTYLMPSHDHSVPCDSDKFLYLKTYYPYAVKSNSASRFHFFPASKPNSVLKGDALKTKILREMLFEIKNCQSEHELVIKGEELRRKDDFDILKQSQGIFSSVFHLPTSSQLAFEEMYESKMEILRFNCYKNSSNLV